MSHNELAFAQEDQDVLPALLESRRSAELTWQEVLGSAEPTGNRNRAVGIWWGLCSRILPNFPVLVSFRLAAADRKP